MATTPKTITRRRRVLEGIHPEAEQAPVLRNRTVEEDLADLWSLKVAADRAAKSYDEAKAALYARMQREHRTLVEIPALDERPAVEAKEARKTTNVIDPAGFRKLVTPEQFLECVTVGVTLAKRYAAESALEKITTPKSGNPYLEVKPKAKAAR